MRFCFAAFRVILACAAAAVWLSAVQPAAAQSNNDPDILAAYVYRYADYYLPYAIQSSTAYKPVGTLNTMRDAGLGEEVDFAVQSTIPASQDDLRGHARKIFKPWRSSTTRTNSAACIIVTNVPGPGVPLAEFENVFRPFHTPQDGRPRAGTGLGLSLVRQIAGRHGGEAKCATMPDGRSCFVVTLPAGGRPQSQLAPAR